MRITKVCDISNNLLIYNKKDTRHMTAYPEIESLSLNQSNDFFSTLEIRITDRQVKSGRVS